MPGIFIHTTPIYITQITARVVTNAIDAVKILDEGIDLGDLISEGVLAYIDEKDLYKKKL